MSKSQKPPAKPPATPPKPVTKEDRGGQTVMPREPLLPARPPPPPKGK